MNDLCAICDEKRRETTDKIFDVRAEGFAVCILYSEVNRCTVLVLCTPGGKGMTKIDMQTKMD